MTNTPTPSSGETDGLSNLDYEKIIGSKEPLLVRSLAADCIRMQAELSRLKAEVEACGGATSGRVIEIDGERRAVSMRVASYIERLQAELAESRAQLSTLREKVLRVLGPFVCPNGIDLVRLHEGKSSNYRVDGLRLSSIHAAADLLTELKGQD